MAWAGWLGSGVIDRPSGVLARTLGLEDSTPATPTRLKQFSRNDCLTWLRSIGIVSTRLQTTFNTTLIDRSGWQTNTVAKQTHRLAKWTHSAGILADCRVKWTDFATEWTHLVREWTHFSKEWTDIGKKWTHSVGEWTHSLAV